VLQKLIGSDGIEVVAVVESQCVKRRNTLWVVDVFDLIRHSGLRYACYLLWITDIFSVLARCFGGVSVKSLCKKNTLPIIKTKDVHSNKTIKELELVVSANKSANTYFVTAMFNQKLSARFLATEDIQCINVHPGSLPDYRGVDPVLAALQNGEQTGCVSLHQTVEELDAGKVLAQHAVAIDASDSLLLNNKRFFGVAANMLVEWLQMNDKPSPKMQQGNAHYYGWPSRKEVAQVPRLLSIRRWRELLLK